MCNDALGYAKVCACWVLRNLTDYHTTVWKVQMCSPVARLMVKAFRNRSSVGDETWPITSNRTQKDYGIASSNFSEKEV